MNANPRMNRLLFTPAVVVGVVLVSLGLLLTLDNLVPRHWDLMRWVFKLWPLILVGIGAAKWRQATQEGRSGTGGVVLACIGGILLLSTVGNVDLGDIIGPLILVAVGIGVVLFGIKSQRQVPPELQQSANFLQGTAILSGFKRRPVTEALKGGELTAIFGGFELDLREATMEGETARFDVFILFGGGELRVPETWEVVNQANAIAGAVEDKTTHSIPAGVSRPRLVITGLCLFGGLEIKH